MNHIRSLLNSWIGGLAAQPVAIARLGRASTRTLIVALAVGAALSGDLLDGSGTAHAGHGAVGCTDINGDGIVSVEDSSIDLGYVGMSVPPGPAQADVNKNGVIQLTDVAAVNAAVGTMPGCQDSPLGPSGYYTQTFIVTANGPPTGVGWAWFMRFPQAAAAQANYTAPIAGLPAAATPTDFATAFAGSINAAAFPGLTAMSDGADFTVTLAPGPAAAIGGMVLG